MASSILFSGLLALFFTTSLASNPSPLQDFCVADTNSQVLLNGLNCKDPKMVDANDFSSSRLQTAGNTSNLASVIAIAALSNQNPGVITIGNVVLGSKPQIPSDILVKAFQVDNNVINYIQSKF
ncbi:hypothetical protein SO802_007048 [Lithocarpus litseifolius]|uniref:Cupin type-1 domain-containing protein n=1 Tax=Lithocarpus litseifolius TaxID=425828 RepID=A0AAW2DMK0_9ROSI